VDCLLVATSIGDASLVLAGFGTSTGFLTTARMVEFPFEWL
jgi:hypothetical protein